MELGIYSFAEINPDPATGTPGSTGERLRDLVEEIELADQVGLDVFGVGEHHRPDYAVSSPAVVLGAAAARYPQHPPLQRGDGAEFRRPRPGLPGFRNPGPAVGRPGGDHGGP